VTDLEGGKMEITQQRKDYVNTPAFAAECRRLVEEWLAAGLPEEEARDMFLTRIVSELSGWNSLPSQEEWEQFVADYDIEIRQGAVRIVKNWFFAIERKAA